MASTVIAEGHPATVGVKLARESISIVIDVARAVPRASMLSVCRLAGS